MGKEIVTTNGMEKSINGYIEKKLDALMESVQNIQNMTPEEIRNFFNEHKDDYCLFDAHNKNKVLESIKDSRHSNLLEKNKAEIAKKRELRELASKNFWQTKLISRLVSDYSGLTNRTLQSMLINDLSDNAFENNKFFADTMKSGTRENKKRAIENKLEQIGKKNFSKFDFANDALFAKNISAFFTASLECDYQNIVNAANSMEIDLTQPRFKGFCDQANAMSSFWFAFGVKQTTTMDPFFENIKFYDIQSLEQAYDFSDLIAEPENSNICLSNSSEQITTMHHNDPTLGGTLKLFDKSIPANQRFAQLLQIPDNNRTKERFYEAEEARNNRINEATLEEKLEMASKSELLFDTPDGLFAKQIIDGRKALAKNPLPERPGRNEKFFAAGIINAAIMQKQYTKDVLNGVAEDVLRQRYSPEAVRAAEQKLLNSADFASFVNDMTIEQFKELKAGYSDTVKNLGNDFDTLVQHRENLRETDIKAYYNEMLDDNIDTLKLNDRTFSINDEEKKAIVTDERIQLHEQAKEFLKQFDELDRFFKENSPGDIPKLFARSMPFILEENTNEAAKERNRQLITAITEPTIEGDMKRKDLLINALNEINTIEAFDPNVQNTDKKRLEKCMSQFKKCNLAFVCKGDLQNTDSSGFSLSPEALQKFNENSKQLEEISSESLAFIRMVASENFLTMPVDKMQSHYKDDPALFATTLMNVQRNEVNKGAIDSLVNINDLNNARRNTGSEIKRNTFSHLDITDTAPTKEKICNDLIDVRRMTLEYGKTLLNADHFYNLRNSNEYKSLLQSIARTNSYFAQQTGAIDENNAQEIYSGLLDMKEKANAYVEKYKNVNRNKNRQIRFETCCKLVNFLNKVVTSDQQNNPDKNYSLDKKFQNWIKTANKTTEQKREGTFTENYYNRIFDIAKQKTESLNALKQSFNEKSTERNAVINLSLARDELTASTKSGEISPERKTYLLAAIACCKPLIKEGAVPKGLTTAQLSNIISTTANNQKFKEFAATFDKEKTAKLLGGYTDKAFDRECTKILGIERNVPVNNVQVERENSIHI